MLRFQVIASMFVATFAVGAQEAPAPDKPVIVELPHTGNRMSVAFSPDGKTLATSGDDDRIRLWDVATAKLKFAIEERYVSRLAYLTDGKTLVSGGISFVRFWDAKTGNHVKTIGSEPLGITVLAVSPDGKWLAWGNGRANLYDIATGRIARTIEGRAVVDWATFSPNSKTISMSEGNSTIQLWDVANGQPIRTFPAKQTSATGSQTAAFSPNGATLATAGDEVRLFDVATGKELRVWTREQRHQFSVAISPDGKHITSGGYSIFQLWDLKTRKEILVRNEKAGSIAFSSDGRWLAVALSGKATLIDLAPAKK